jgi:hypothetical protein
MVPLEKPLVWLHGIKTPPFTASARLEAGFLLRKLQKGERSNSKCLRLTQTCASTAAPGALFIIERIVILEVFEPNTEKSD